MGSVVGLFVIRCMINDSREVFANEAGLLRCAGRTGFMAASNDRIVSNGRSNRGRVGFERSGSAGDTRSQ